MPFGTYKTLKIKQFIHVSRDLSPLQNLAALMDTDKKAIIANNPPR